MGCAWARGLGGVEGVVRFGFALAVLALRAFAVLALRAFAVLALRAFALAVLRACASCRAPYWEESLPYTRARVRVSRL